LEIIESSVFYCYFSSEEVCVNILALSQYILNIDFPVQRAFLPKIQILILVVDKILVLDVGASRLEHSLNFSVCELQAEVGR